MVLLPLESQRVQVRDEGDIVNVAVDGKPRYVFPRKDCALLPIPNTTVEMLAELLAERLRAELDEAGRPRRDGDRDGSRGELRPERGLSGHLSVTNGAMPGAHQVGGIRAVQRRRHERAITPADASSCRSSASRTPPPASSVTSGAARRRARSRADRGRGPIPRGRRRARSSRLRPRPPRLERVPRAGARPAQRASDRPAVAQVEAEHNRVTPDRRCDVSERGEGWQRFQANHHARRTTIAGSLRLCRGRRPRIEPDRKVARQHAAHGLLVVCPTRSMASRSAM